jgi:hypothetical protein
MDTESPTFWGVWTPGYEWPELFASRDDAVKRAYEVAQSRAGITAHLMQMTSAGTVRYPLHPTATGVLASSPPRLLNE